MTVLEVIQRGTEFLTRKGVESPRLQVELLLAHVLKRPRMQLYLNFEKVLDASQVPVVRDLIARRGQREPLQHIVGTAPFAGREFQVSRHVLVPRPESELLAERACQFLSSLPLGPLEVLDFGTGSGCLAITIAARHLGARVSAVDVSPEALVIASENARRLGVSIEFLEGNGFQVVPAMPQFHLIVANPPYIPSAEIDTLEPEVKDFDPRLALDGGPDGLDFHRRLAGWAREHLRPEGRLMVEFGDGQEAVLPSLLAAHKWVVEAVVPDYIGREPFLVAAPGPE